MGMKGNALMYVFLDLEVSVVLPSFSLSLKIYMLIGSQLADQ